MAGPAGSRPVMRSGMDELRQNRSAGRIWKPEMEDARRNMLCRGWKKAVTRTFDWIE